MKLNFLLFFIIAIAMSSCSTMYKSGQTPDDVYYSPAREIKKNTDNEVNRNTEDGYTYEERNIRMRAYDHRWRTIDDRYDDYGYRYDPYNYGYTYGYYYNPYYYATPVYCNGVTITNPKNSVPRMTNLGSYKSTPSTSIDPKTGGTLYNANNNYRKYNNSNSTNAGKVINKVRVFNNNNMPSQNRTYNPSSSSGSSRSSSGSGSSSSGGSVQRNTRGNQ